MAPLTPAQVANQATLAARKHIERYYDACLRSDDELHPTQTRDVALRSAAAPYIAPGCNTFAP